MSTVPSTRDIKALVPHRDDMLLLDEVLDADEDHARCRVTISPQSSFFVDGWGVPAWVGLEYLAQTVAVIGGATAQSQGRSVADGYLLGTRRLVADVAWFAAGQVLTVQAGRRFVDGNGLGVYDCQISIGEQVVARCPITVLQPVSPDQDET